MMVFNRTIPKRPKGLTHVVSKLRPLRVVFVTAVVVYVLSFNDGVPETTEERD